MCATGTLPVANQMRIARRTDEASLHHTRRLGNSTLSTRIVQFLVVRDAESTPVLSDGRARGIPVSGS